MLQLAGVQCFDSIQLPLGTSYFAWDESYLLEEAFLFVVPEENDVI